MARDDDADEAPAAAPRKGLNKNLVLIIVGAIALVGTSVGGSIVVMKMMTPDAPVAAAAKKRPAAAASNAADGEDAAGDGEDAAGDGEDAAGDGEDAAGDGEDGPADGEDDDPEAGGESAVATYFDFDQPFVVNFQDEGQLRYLQITVSVMVTGPKGVEDVRRHMPVIRNNLVMLFSAQTREAMISRDGKEKLRKDAEAEVQKILRERTRRPGIKSLYFTSFVMQ